MTTIQHVRDTLPEGFEVLRHAADGEAYDMLAMLAREWADGSNRFDQPGEALVAAMDGDVLAGMGGMNIDPFVYGALRMRRFYVRPAYRRKGVARLMADALLDRPEIDGRTITLSAPQSEAARFWEALGFIRDDSNGHTHVLSADYAHA